MPKPFRFKDQVETREITHSVCGPKKLVEYQPLNAEDNTFYFLQIVFKWLPPDGRGWTRQLGRRKEFDNMTESFETYPQAGKTRPSLHPPSRAGGFDRTPEQLRCAISHALHDHGRFHE
jgi:hypothetical protein